MFISDSRTVRSLTGLTICGMSLNLVNVKGVTVIRNCLSKVVAEDLLTSLQEHF